MKEEKTAIIKVILNKMFKDDKSEWMEEVNPHEVIFWRPVNADIMQRFRLIWDNDLNFRIEKSNQRRWILQIFQMSRWFDVHDHLRVRFLDVVKYLKHYDLKKP